MKIKIFENLDKNFLENEINAFITENIQIIDIKYNIFLDEDNNLIYNAMLLYKEEV